MFWNTVFPTLLNRGSGVSKRAAYHEDELPDLSVIALFSLKDLVFASHSNYSSWV
jgi:hypothetical protein